jgi:hypothetical protein
MTRSAVSIQVLLLPTEDGGISSPSDVTPATYSAGITLAAKALHPIRDGSVMHAPTHA